MTEDMLIRNIAVRTIDSYTYHVDRFAKHFGKLPDDLGPEEIRTFQLWMIQYLFPGKSDDVPLSGATVQKACKLAAASASIKKSQYAFVLSNPTGLSCGSLGSYLKGDLLPSHRIPE